MDEDIKSLDNLNISNDSSRPINPSSPITLENDQFLWLADVIE